MAVRSSEINQTLYDVDHQADGAAMTFKE